MSFFISDAMAEGAAAAGSQDGGLLSMLPLLLYGLCGSSMTLAIGPVAIVSLMVASALSGVAEPGSELYVSGAITLAMLSGVILVLLGIARFDYFVNYLSRPVISGFISAADGCTRRPQRHL